MENIIILISLGASDLTMISGTNEVSEPRKLLDQEFPVEYF
jgi:hypothetical protein